MALFLLCVRAYCMHLPRAPPLASANIQNNKKSVFFSKIMWDLKNIIVNVPKVPLQQSAVWPAIFLSDIAKYKRSKHTYSRTERHRVPNDSTATKTKWHDIFSDDDEPYLCRHSLHPEPLRRHEVAGLRDPPTNKTRGWNGRIEFKPLQ